MDIVGIIPEDSGNYTCEVRGPQSMVILHTTHQLFVRGKLSMTLDKISLTWSVILFYVVDFPSCSNIWVMTAHSNVKYVIRAFAKELRIISFSSDALRWWCTNEDQKGSWNTDLSVGPKIMMSDIQPARQQSDALAFMKIQALFKGSKIGYVSEEHMTREHWQESMPQNEFDKNTWDTNGVCPTQ